MGKDGATTISLFTFLVSVMLALILGCMIGMSIGRLAFEPKPKRVPPGDQVWERRKRERDAGEESKIIQSQCTYSGVRGCTQGRFDVLRGERDGAWYD